MRYNAEELVHLFVNFLTYFLIKYVISVSTFSRLIIVLLLQMHCPIPNIVRNVIDVSCFSTLGNYANTYLRDHLLNIFRRRCTMYFLQMGKEIFLRIIAILTNLTYKRFCH